MRAPTRPELLLVVVVTAVFFLWRSGVGSADAKEAELKRADAARVELERENGTLRDAMEARDREKAEADRMAADAIARLRVVIADAERAADEAGAEGREAYEALLESVADSPEVRALVERREVLHENQVAVLETVIDAERDAAAVLRDQLRAANALCLSCQALVSGLESELEAANEQIAIRDDLLHDGLSNLEAAGLGLGGYVIATEALGATPLEGLIVGGGTFVVTKGGSKLLGWIF